MLVFPELWQLLRSNQDTTALRSSDFPNCVDCLPLAFIIGARQHFADKTEGYELNSADDQEDSGKQQRTVLSHHVDVRDEFSEQKEQGGQAACARAHQTPGAEELQRPGGVIQQEFDANQI